MCFGENCFSFISKIIYIHPAHILNVCDEICMKNYLLEITLRLHQNNLKQINKSFILNYSNAPHTHALTADRICHIHKAFEWKFNSDKNGLIKDFAPYACLEEVFISIFQNIHNKGDLKTWPHEKFIVISLLIVKYKLIGNSFPIVFWEQLNIAGVNNFVLMIQLKYNSCKKFCTNKALIVLVQVVESKEWYSLNKRTPGLW